MMNKEYALSLALLISMLPGCGGKKCCDDATKPMTRNNMVADANDVVEQEDTQLLSWYEDVQEFAEIDADYKLDLADADDAIDTEDTQTFAWSTENEDKEFDTLYFAFNSNKVSDDQKEALEYNIAELKQIFAEAEEAGDEPIVVVSGHSCNSAGSPEYNKLLSEQRAQAIADKIIAAGIDEDCVKVVARGSEMPTMIDGDQVNGDREDQWLNRRTEVSVIYT